MSAHSSLASSPLSNSRARVIFSSSTVPHQLYNPEPSTAFNRKRARGSFSNVPGEDDIRLAKRKKKSNPPFDNEPKRTPEVKEYMNAQTLQLARISRDAYNAKVLYQRLRVRELEMMRSVAEDELEESQVCLTQVERRIGKIRKQLYANGDIASIDQCRQQWTSIFDGSDPSCTRFNRDTESESSDQGSDGITSYHDGSDILSLLS